MNRASFTTRLGVLGGMGPQATADFYLKLVSATDAATDQDHVATIISSVPQIPDRSAAIAGNGLSPLPALSEGIRELVSVGAGAIAIPCNTAHFWHGELAAISPVPVFHIVDAAAVRLNTLERDGPVGVLATRGTIAANIYQRRLETQGAFQIMIPTENDQETLVSPGIAAVKAGDLNLGADLLAQAAQRLRARGAGSAIMACTEIPLVLGTDSNVGMTLIDATEALARHCVEWWREIRGEANAIQPSNLHLAGTTERKS